MKLEIEAPWGKLELDEYGPTFLPLLDHVIAELEMFLKQGVSPNPIFTLRDLAGYKAVRETNSEAIAETFFRTKWAAQDAGKRFANNLAVVQYMKENGLWK